MTTTAFRADPLRFRWWTPLLLAVAALASAVAGILIEGIFGGDARAHGMEFWRERAPFDFMVLLIGAFGLVAVMAVAGMIAGRADSQMKPRTLALVHVGAALGIPLAWIMVAASTWRSGTPMTEMMRAMLVLGGASVLLNLPCTAALFWAARARR